MSTVNAQIDMSLVYAAYAKLGEKAGKNLIRRALRAALIPVRQAQRTAWLSAKFREGRRAPRKERNSGMFKRTRTRKVNPIVVRKAVAKSIRINVDRLSNGSYIAGVGIDYAKSGVKSQQRVAHILEGGRTSPRLAAGHILEGINKSQQEPTLKRFADYVHKELQSGD